MMIRRFSHILIVLLFVIFATPYASATCSYYRYAGNVAADVMPGASDGSLVSGSYAAYISVNCYQTPSSPMRGVVTQSVTLPSNIPIGNGLSLKLYYNGKLMNGVKTILPSLYIGTAIQTYSAQYDLTVEVVRTSDYVAAGSFDIPIRVDYATDENGTYSRQSATTHLAATVTLGACTQADDINITLDEVGTGDFSGVGSEAGLYSFNASLFCLGPVKAKLTFSDSNNPSNATTILGLSNSSTADGVGLQLLVNRVPLTFGQSVEVANFQSGVASLPMEVKYIKTKNVITPGTVQASTTYVLEYL